MKKIRFGDMRWPEIAEVLKKSNVVIVPIGATEQHGRHLPVNFDYYSATYQAEEAARKVTDEGKIHVLVAPTIPYGEAFGMPPFKKMLPGTITITADTVIRLVMDVVRSLVVQGFNNIFVLNGHAENNAPVDVALRELSIEFKDREGLGLFATSSFLLGSEAWMEISKGGRTAQGHAGERETAIAMAIEPENVQPGVVYEGNRIDSLPPKYVTPFCRELVFSHTRLGGVRDSGVQVMDPNATKEMGEKCVAAVVDALVEIITSIAKSEGMTHKDKV
jgi:creatinine amidohydrolase